MPSKITIHEDQLSDFLTSIFNKGAVEVVTAYSEFGGELEYFQNSDSIIRYTTQFRSTQNRMMHLVIRYLDSGPSIHVRKIELNSKRYGENARRYSADGWGLINLFCEFNEIPFVECSLSANSEKRAQKWKDTDTRMGDPDDWNWPKVQRHNRRLQRVLKRLSEQTLE